MEILKDLRIDDLIVIGQSVEKEIIFCYHIRRRRILCFDQHAVHERIRYENLLNNMKPGDSLDMIKSEACHKAIKFGTPLSINDCQNLVGQLLLCKVPFKCAHSRCSVCVLESLDRVLFIDELRERYSNRNKKRRT